MVGASPKVKQLLHCGRRRDEVDLALRRTDKPGMGTLPDSCIICRDYAGLQAQALGLGERAGFAPDTLSIEPRAPWRWMPPRLWSNPLQAAGLAALPPGALAITAGGAGGAVGAAMRRRGVRVVQVQDPRLPLDRFDLVVVNRHDRLRGDNVVSVRTALHRATPERLAAARLVWAPRLAALPRPLVVVLVGGSNGRHRLERPDGAALAASLALLMRRDHVGLALTPSRRTSAAVREVLGRELAPLGAWLWDMTGENPYYGLLACADAIVATVDSVSMVSEAVATTAPVLLARLPGRSRRIDGFMQSMVDEGRARGFNGRLESWDVRPLDDTQEAADAMRRRLGF